MIGNDGPGRGARARAVADVRVLALLLLLCAPASALTIRDDPGGYLDKHAYRFYAVVRRGEPIRVLGLCASACTLVLGLPRVCVGPRAAFGFHGAFYADRRGRFVRGSASGNRFLWRHYPPRVRAWLTRHGGLTRKLKIMGGHETGLPRC